MTTTLDYPLFAGRAEGYRPSPVRDFWAISMQPGFISLAGENNTAAVTPTPSPAAQTATPMRRRRLDTCEPISARVAINAIKAPQANGKN